MPQSVHETDRKLHLHKVGVREREGYSGKRLIDVVVAQSTSFTVVHTLGHLREVADAEAKRNWAVAL